MKKILVSILLIATITATAFGAQLSPFAFPFIGRWQPSENPLLLDDYGLQDIQNLRKDGKHFKGVSGHTAINTNAPSDGTRTYTSIINGFHFRKDQPSESHVIIYAADTVTPTTGKLFQNTTAIPGTGDFSGTVLHSPSAFNDIWRFSAAPAGNMIATNGDSTLIWGGNEIEATSFITSATTILYSATSAEDHTDRLDNTRQTADQIATISVANGTNYFLVGSKRPLKGVKFYVSSANVTASALTVKEWQGNWQPLTVTDNTDTGAALAVTGTVTWTSTGSAAVRYIHGLSLYWYQFHLSAGAATLYYVTVDAPIQEIRNIWDGIENYAVSCLKWDGTTYRDYTDDVGDGSSSTYADLSNFATTHALYLGFLEPQQGISFKFVAGSENVNVSGSTLNYWNGKTWTATSAQYDGTGGSTMAYGGTLSFQPTTPGTEFKRSISSEFPLYYYQYVVSATLDADVKIAEITGITTPPPMSVFKFSETFQNKLFLFNEKSGGKNKAIYSVTNAPDIFNGYDSGEIIFGDRTELIAAAVVYNVFTDTAVEQLLVAKKNETWRLSGDTSDNWTLKKISSNVGCVAPLSMIAAEAIDTGPDQKRTIVIWVSDRGPVMSTGSSVIPIYDDIKCYWDPHDSRFIPTAWQSKSVGRYDTQTRSYKLLIASGAASTFLNTELEFSLVNKEWTKLYRENAAGANPLQSIWPVWDTNGIGYSYGGGKDGYVYRLENGNTWNATANIASYLWTKDLILDNEKPLFRQSTVKYLRTAYKQKAMGNITISHYGDRALTVSGSSGQSGPAVISSGSTTWYDTQSVNLGRFLYHSFKFTASTAITDGMELNGFGLYFEPFDIMR